MKLTDRRTRSHSLKRSEDAEKPKIVGHFNTFNTLSEPIWGFYKEEIKPGAFSRSLKEAEDIGGLFDHQSAMVLGSTKSGTMTLAEDNVGLYGEIDPVDAYYSQGLINSLTRGDIDSASFGFYYVTTQWRLQDEWDVLEVHDLDLVEVSVVKFPAFRATQIGIRSFIKDVEEIEPAQQAPLLRAFNRLEHKLDMTDDDKSIIFNYRSLLSKVLPDDHKKILDRLTRHTHSAQLSTIAACLDALRD